MSVKIYCNLCNCAMTIFAGMFGMYKVRYEYVWETSAATSGNEIKCGSGGQSRHDFGWPRGFQTFNPMTRVRLYRMLTCLGKNRPQISTLSKAPILPRAGRFGIKHLCAHFQHTLKNFNDLFTSPLDWPDSTLRFFHAMAQKKRKNGMFLGRHNLLRRISYNRPCSILIFLNNIILQAKPSSSELSLIWWVAQLHEQAHV